LLSEFFLAKIHMNIKRLRRRKENSRWQTHLPKLL
jgi:hypothetical protein